MYQQTSFISTPNTLVLSLISKTSKTMGYEVPSPPIFSDPFVRYSRTILDNFPLFSDTYVEETIINAWCCLAGTKHRCPKIRAASFFKKFH